MLKVKRNPGKAVSELTYIIEFLWMNIPLLAAGSETKAESRSIGVHRLGSGSGFRWRGSQRH